MSHMHRSPLLGEAKVVTVPHGDVEYFERGEGATTLVFAHGWLANANLYRHVVDILHHDFRCIVLDLPLGSHRVPLPVNADVAPDGIAALIASVLEALDLREVVLVGTDSGGAYSQIAVARHTDRVARLVLNSCETPFDRFPPAGFEWLWLLGRDPQALAQTAEGLRDPAVQQAAYGPGAGVMKRLPEPEVLASYALPGAENADVRANAAHVISSASTAAVVSAGEVLKRRADLPVLLVWSSEDTLLPAASAQKYAEVLPSAELVLVDDALIFSPEDQPAAVAAAIGRFAVA